MLIISWLILFSYLQKNSSRRIMKYNHLLLEIKDSNQNNIIYDVESFFDYLLNEADLFMKTINLIIQEMNVILNIRHALICCQQLNRSKLQKWTKITYSHITSAKSSMLILQYQPKDLLNDYWTFSIILKIFSILLNY